MPRPGPLLTVGTARDPGVVVLTQPATRRPGHPRLTVLAAALSVLAVLTLPPTVAWIVDLAAPTDGTDLQYLTDDAAEVVRLTGATVVAGRVVVEIRPGTGVPALDPSRLVPPESAAGDLVTLEVRGLVPMQPAVAPPSISHLTDRLTPWVDEVFADVGELSVGCLTGEGSGAPADGCALSLLVRHGEEYYRFPGLPPARFIAEGSAMEARSYDAVDGELVVGRLPQSFGGSEVAQVIVSLADHSIVPTTLSRTVSPGDLVWWSTIGVNRPVSATAYDASGRDLASFVLAGS